MTQPINHEDFARLFVQSQRRVYGFILTVIPDANEADEIFQETSLILWKKAGEFDPELDFVRWACGIAMNVIRNRRVKQSRDRHVFSETLLNEIATVRQTRGDWLEERTSLLSACMQRLSEGQRQLLQRFYGGRTSASEIAGEQGVTENALFQRLHRIRRRLFDCVSHLQRTEAT